MYIVAIIEPPEILSYFSPKNNFSITRQFQPHIFEIVNLNATHLAGVFFNEQYDDVNHAIYFYSKSSDQGNSAATGELGYILLLESKYADDKKRALDLLTTAAKKDNTFSQVLLGRMYLKGDLLEKDEVKSLFWLKKAAASQDPKSMALYALTLFRVASTQDEYKTAIKHLEQVMTLEKKGLIDLAGAPELLLSKAYRNGLGVPVDIKKAEEWSDKAFEKRGE